MPGKAKARKKNAPGRPRSDATRTAILKAAYEILVAGGFAAFTIEGVAARAGAGKATIYRWWPSKGALAVEAFMIAVVPRMDSVRETRSGIADLRQHVQMAARIYRGRAGALLRELLALSQEDETTRRQLQKDFLEPRRRVGMATLRRALDSGELNRRVDPEVLADALWGPIFHRLLVTSRPMDVRSVDRLLDIVLRGASAR
jgi:AcrR family transcriptional regulator